MNILKHIKGIYQGKNNLSNHISLFSIFGIMTIVLNNYIASNLSSMYASYFGFAPAANLEIYIDIIIGVMLLIFSVGYFYEFVNNSYSESDKLPELSLKPYCYFFKMLPIALMWINYMAFFTLLGFNMFKIDSPMFALYYALLFCLIPFVDIILILYAKDFKFTIEAINPLKLVKIIDKTFSSVILLLVKIFITAIIPICIIYLSFRYSVLIKNSFVQLGLRLGTVCISVYLVNILRYIYSVGCVEIIKNKLLDED